MRFERKYQINNSELNSIPLFLKLNKFKEIYSQRKVNSIYYETDNLLCYFEAENGYNSRKKIRLRYYNNDHKNFNIEYKLKKGSLNKKEFLSCDCFKKNEMIPVKFLGFSNFDDFLAPIKLEHIYKPKLLISYERKYYISPDNNLRLTIDFDLNFHKSTVYENYILMGYKKNYQKSVLEIKYDQSHLPNFKFINSLTSQFNLDLTKSSKFVQGILNLNLV